MGSIPVEICINCVDRESTIRAVTAARLGGASRLELCSHMDLDGLTPAPSLIAAARSAWGEGTGLLAMIRPRAGDFVYSAAEAGQMGQQIRDAAQAGADGVVFGAVRHARGRSTTGGLTNFRQTDLDVDLMETLLRIVKDRGLTVTCHRAFDVVTDFLATLALLGNLGVDRVLTSGTPWGSGLSMADGVDRLADLLVHAPPGLEIVLGGGVDAATIGPILARLPHGAAKCSVHAYSSVLRDGVTDADAVADLVRAVA